ncbi:hypothetical protein V9T40_003859 [Parthenolecanium corni]|uniref:COX assembly mitochondrial protein n=1 Tax=Parthenolecanium corni TaxID=536013 RepID=A0AAN9YAS2_9HEMI
MSENSNEKPKKSRYGPHGVGNPDDLSLRKMELNILIPQYRREIVKNEKCPKEIDEYQNCVLEHGLFKASISCRSEKVALHNCLEFWNDDEELFLRAKKRYLEERSEYRRTGVSKDNREIVEQYLEDKKKEQEQNNQLS